MTRRACLSLLLFAVGCRDGAEHSGTAAATAGKRPAATHDPSVRPFRPGVRFNPMDIRPGATVGHLVLDSIDARRVLADSVVVGVARFRGEIELTGATMRHPDPDPGPVCFEADSASAARLPRWSGDERRAWFCFSNHDQATRVLGPPSEGVRLKVVIDRFTIHSGLSDEVNSARLVRAERAAGGASNGSMPGR